MGVRSMTLVLAGVLAISGCDEEEESVEQGESAIEAEPVPQAERAPTQLDAPPPAPEMGGVLIQAGEHQVEVLPHQSGDIEARVRTEAGEPIEAPERAGVTVEVAGAAEGETHGVPLQWNADRSVFLGSVSTEAEIGSGPVAVTLELDGEKSTGRADRVALAPLPRHGGSIMLAGDFATEVRAEAGGGVHAYLYDGAGEPIEDPDVTSIVVRSGEGAMDIDREVALQEGAEGEAATEGETEAEGEGRARLTWNAGAGRFEGRMEGTAEITARPLTVAIFKNAETRIARRNQVAFAPEPRHEGRVLIAGGHTIELVPQGKRKVHAHVYGPDGTAIEGGADLDLHLVLGARGRGTAKARGKAKAKAKPAALEWNADAGRFEGRLTGRAALKGAPVTVFLTTPDAQHVAGMASFAIEPGPRARAKGKAKGKAEGKGKAGGRAAAKAAKGAAGVNVRANVGAKEEKKRKRGGASGSAGGSIEIGGGGGINVGN